MSGLAESVDEYETLKALRDRTKTAAADAWEAFETNRFSDAKTSVFEVWQILLKTEKLSPERKKPLLEIAEQGWNAIVDRSDGNEAAAMRAHAFMAQLGRRLDDLLEPYSR